VIVLYGPPGVGKLTVAKELARRRPFQILHFVRKLTDASELQRVLERYDFYTRIPGRPSLSIDVARLVPADARTASSSTLS
jgi:replication-associated recombination protein RarA